ncbi:MAG: DUF1512 family protein [Candidatus Aenigmarchaeota archaeon]|nr:DUF1512 family protein [Candidatus Aenigmarchaeota archaeon]
MPILNQFGETSYIHWIFIIILFILLPLIQPRIYLAQALWRLEQSSTTLEEMTESGKKIVIKKISKKPRKELQNAINNFLEFFVITPVSLDPFGIMKKLEHLMILEEKRFKYFVKSIAPHLDVESQWDLIMGLSGAITLNQITKIVRHLTELVRKTKNWQLGMLYTMQLSLIESLAKALLKGTEALTNGWPIGDSIGNLVGAHLIGNAKTKEIEEDTLLARRKIKRKDVLIIKSKGPGGRLGKLGKAVEKLVKREKIAKIITVDAAAKLEGEKTGNIAEGVGVAVGGIGVDRAYIENIAVQKGIPLDSIVIKMSQEEAIQPMKAEILSASGKALRAVEDSIARTKERGKIIVVGVGNSSGIGNNKKDAEEAEKKVKKILQILKARKEEKRKFSWLIGE